MPNLKKCLIPMILLITTEAMALATSKIEFTSPFGGLAGSCDSNWPSMNISVLNPDYPDTYEEVTVSGAGLSWSSYSVNSRLERAPMTNSNLSYGMSGPGVDNWGFAFPENTIVTATLSTYQDNKVIYSTAVSWNCTTGEFVGEIVNRDLTVNAAASTVPPVPTLSTWALALLGALTAGVGLRRGASIRQQRTTSSKVST